MWPLAPPPGLDVLRLTTKMGLRSVKPTLQGEDKGRKGRRWEERGGEGKREEREAQRSEKTFPRLPCKQGSDLIMKSFQDGAGKRI